jgi:hypothetical protein
MEASKLFWNIFSVLLTISAFNLSGFNSPQLCCAL